MLTQESINKIAEITKIEPSLLSEAITSNDESNIEIPPVISFMSDELSRRDSNLQKQKYDEGKTAGAEILIKDLKERYSVDIDGKDPDRFIEAFKTKTLEGANIEPDKKVKELQDIVDNLKATNTELEKEKISLESSIRLRSLKSKAFSGLESEFLLSNDKVFKLMENDGYTLEEDDGDVVFRLNGNIVRDTKTQDALSANKVIEEYAQKENILKKEESTRSGRGDKSTRGSRSSVTSFSQLQKEWEESGKSINSSEFSAKAMELAKDNPDFYNN